MRRLLRRKETQEQLQVSDATLDRMVARGELPVVRVSTRSIRFRETDIRAYLRARTRRQVGSGDGAT